jgi:hypothetical protein
VCNRTPSVPAGASAWIAVATFAAAGVVVQLFRIYDWNCGVARGFLLLVTGGIVLAAGQLARRRPLTLAPSKLWGRAALLGLAVALAVNIVDGIRSIRTAHSKRQIQLDQGQTSYRAARYLLAGINPYGQRTMGDPDAYFIQTGRWADRTECVQYSRPHLIALQRAFWQRPGAPTDGMEALFPAVSPDARCGDVRRGFGSLGYKYGPVALAGYVPAVALFEEAGVYVNHLLLFLALVGLLGCLAYRISGGSLLAAVLPCLLVTVPSHYRHNLLVLSASDQTAVLLGLAFLVAWWTRSYALAAVLLGCAIGSKTLPGVLFAPLLLKAPRRTSAYLAATLVAVYAPFAMWDPVGLANNILYPLRGHGSDSTALVHFLPSWAGTCLLVVVSLALLLLLAFTHRQGWTGRGSLRFLFWAHVGALLTGSYFHNNYLVWLIPVLGLTLLAELTEPRASC